MGFFDLYAYNNSPGNNGVSAVTGGNFPTETQPEVNPEAWYEWSAEDIIAKAERDPDWYKNNAGLIDYILEERSYDRRASQNIKSQFQQLKELGINPLLASSLLSGVSLSGGASSGSASYLASRENNRVSTQTSRENAISKAVISAFVGIAAALIAALL